MDSIKYVGSVLLYGSETWDITKKVETPLRAVTGE